MMNPEIEKVVDRLLQSYSTYYDIETCDDQDLVAKASFHSRGEKYLLTRSVNLWSVEDNEYVFVYAGDHLSREDMERAVRTSSDTGLGMIEPGPEHRSSMITTILIYDKIDGNCAESIKKFREHRNFGFMLRGWMDHRVAALETSTSTIVSNRAGRDVAKNLENVAETPSR